MPDRLLHALNVPSDAQQESGSTRQRKLSKQGVLQSDVSSTETISSQPGRQTIAGQVRGRLAPLIAAELEELFNASGVDVVPYTLREGDSTTDGYYSPENINEDFADARDDRIQDFDGTLTPKGTRRSHWRAVRTNPQTEDNPFGTASTPEIGLSIRARKVRWFDDVGGAVVDATPQRRVEGEHDYLDIYDASDPAFDRPVLIYDIPYADEYRTDCTIWDTYNRPKIYKESGDVATVGSATVGSATVSGYDIYVASQWQRVYVTDHDWIGDMVLETDRLRLVIDQPEDVLRAYRWSPADGQYTIVQLGNAPWRLWDIDLTHVGLARIEAQIEFEDLNTGDRHNLNATLVRGLDDVVFTVPTNGSSPPQGLIDRLNPIADDSDRVVQAAGDVVKRTEVDR
ncbi:hypothetical protein [Haloarcula sp. K1]|uniref:hypothetical protein n=1 Tax=Haloarcula sp. K1 TaxID=1622207 RepID=UPI0007BAE54F|nr:hypothetical protein [Haloarcula sp. K1]KZX49302.1 hypothetical protein AV929_12215 [Haloarcula sp. K1]